MKIETIDPPEQFRPVQITLNSAKEVIALRFILSSATNKEIRDNLDRASACVTPHYVEATRNSLQIGIGPDSGVNAECPK